MEANRVGLGCDESRCVVARTRFVGNDVGLDVRTTGAAVTDSTFRDNGTALASFAAWGPGTVERSTFTGNGVAVDAFWSDLTLTGNVLRGNDLAFTASGTSGAVPTLVANRFVRIGDAVVIEQPGVALGDNVAFHNAGWGIYAPDAVDLGGNTARGNGHDPQCVGVSCTPTPTS